MGDDQRVLATLPSVDRVLRHPKVASALRMYARPPLVRAVRAVLEEQRKTASRERLPDLDGIADLVLERIAASWALAPKAVINATGVLLHTNLGRAPLADVAVDAMARASAYSGLEFDLSRGIRGSRHGQIAGILRDLLGAEDALVSVNNAAALLLALASTCKGKEVLISRGEAVEIGGGVRVPEILRQSGARLVDVGTTNKTRLDDFRSAISSRTGAILRVHASNFRISGFTETPCTRELSRLARESGILLISDVGSGAMVPTEQYGLRHEVMPEEELAAGADIVTFSGDKLLGGPQAGIMAGRCSLIQLAGRSALARAVRPDKLVLAALCATLLVYLRGEYESQIPVWQMIAQTEVAIHRRVLRLADGSVREDIDGVVEQSQASVGGGTLPGETLPSWRLRLPRSLTVRALRSGAIPVVAGARDGRSYLDLRSVLPGEDENLLHAMIDAHRSRFGSPQAMLDSAAQ